MAERGLRGVPEKAPVARAPRIGETSKSISGTKSAVTLKKAPSVQKSIDAKIQAMYAYLFIAAVSALAI